MELVITVALFALAVAAAGALWCLVCVSGKPWCWRCGKELTDEDEWHLDLTRFPGKVFCRQCWERSMTDKPLWR